MDPASFIGLLVAFGALFGMITMEHVGINGLIIPAPMILVFGSSIGVAIMGSTLKDAIASFAAIPKAFLGKAPKFGASIDEIVGFAEVARSQGLLALEQEASKQNDPFVTKALQNIADGTDGEDLRILLEDGIEQAAAPKRTASKFFMSLGGYAPTVGIIGTVVSLTHVLENLSKPDELGPLIASAFVATLWGLLSANFLWLPIGARLKKLSDLEVLRMTVQMEGLLAMQAGAQPRMLGERLRTMVPADGKGEKAGKSGKPDLKIVDEKKAA